MKSILQLVAVAALVLTSAAQAAETADHHAGMHAAPAETHAASGVVKRVDASKGQLVIAHQPVKSLDWPAMTMPFTLRDKTTASTFKPGDKVGFDIVIENEQPVISRISKQPS